jgi:hypothetical protein
LPWNLQKPRLKPYQKEKTSVEVGRVNEHEHQSGQDVIPELRLIREIVQLYMPKGHRLNNIDLTIGTIDDSQEPRFMVLVELVQEEHAPEPFGWADKMAKVIRAKWPKDVFDIKVTILMA